MSRKNDREALEKMLIADGICDAIENAIYRGDMTKVRGDWWYHSFANYYKMDELLPRKDKATIKRGIAYRLKCGMHRVKTYIPGGFPKVKVDKTYKPVHVVAKAGPLKSKYSSAAA